VGGRVGGGGGVGRTLTQVRSWLLVSENFLHFPLGWVPGSAVRALTGVGVLL
jgi:hypothetical protein